MNNFHYAISLAQMLYEVEGDTEDMEEIGLIAIIISEIKILDSIKQL